MPDGKTIFRKADQSPQGVFPESPAIKQWYGPRNCAEGTVQTVTRGAVGDTDTCTVSFRGAVLRAFCAHPGIRVGDTVSMIEQPWGTFWATKQQNSWFRRPLSELIKAGKPATAALEYILSRGRLWQPELKITLNSAWTATITTTSLFPTWVFFVQEIDGVEYPSALPGDVPERLKPLIPGFYGDDAVPVTDDAGESTRVYTGAANATIKSLLIVPYRWVSHQPAIGTAYIEFFPSESFVDTIDLDVIRISVNGSDYFAPTFTSRDVDVIPPDSGDTTTTTSCEAYQAEI